MDEKQHTVVLCDAEEEYAQLMSEYLRRHKEIPWEIHTYTSPEELLQREEQGAITILVVAESTYTEEMKALQPMRIVVLNESGVIKWDRVHNINKYQQAELVLKGILEIFVDIADTGIPMMRTEFGTRFVGIYSPVRRCLQTTFALSMSQLLAREHRTLYLNFEHYAGNAELLPDAQTRDLADLLYFLTTEKEKFRLRFQTMLQHKGELDYIPPMKVGQNLLPITSVEWLSLFQKIGEMGEYEYVVLDLSDSMQGLFDILRMCFKVYTLTKEDKIAQSKLTQYEQLLSWYNYDDVLEKTEKCILPKFRKLPEDLEQYSRGELAEYAEKEVARMYSQAVCNGGTEHGVHRD